LTYRNLKRMVKAAQCGLFFVEKNI